jgi:hypothetical protein
LNPACLHPRESFATGRSAPDVIRVLRPSTCDGCTGTAHSFAILYLTQPWWYTLRRPCSDPEGCRQTALV